MTDDPTKPGATWNEVRRRLNLIVQCACEDDAFESTLWGEEMRSETVSTWLTVWAVQRPRVLKARAEGYTHTRAQISDYLANESVQRGGPQIIEQRGILRADFPDESWLAFESAHAGVSPHDDCWRQLSERPALPYDTQRTVEERAGIPCEPCTAADPRDQVVYLNECLHKDMVERLGEGARVFDQPLGVSLDPTAPDDMRANPGWSPLENNPHPGGGGKAGDSPLGEAVAPASVRLEGGALPSGVGEEGAETMPSLPARITVWRVVCLSEKCGAVAPNVSAPLSPPLCPSCGRDDIAVYDSRIELPDPLPPGAVAFAHACDLGAVKWQRATKEPRACEVCLRPVQKGESYLRRLGTNSPRRAHEACVHALAGAKPDPVARTLGTLPSQATADDWA